MILIISYGRFHVPFFLKFLDNVVFFTIDPGYNKCFWLRPIAILSRAATRPFFRHFLILFEVIFDLVSCFYIFYRRRSIKLIHLFSGPGLFTIILTRFLDLPVIVERAGSHIYTQLSRAPDQNYYPLKFITKIVSKIMLIQYDLSTRILTCSDLAKQSFIQNGIFADKVVAITLGVDSCTSQISEVLQETYSRNSVITVGGNYYRKGIDIFLDVASDLKMKSCKDTIFYCICPEVPQSIIEHYQSNIVFIDRLPRESLLQLMSNASCLCLLSREDGFGMVVSEAISVGTPCVVSNAVGASEIILEGQTGFVVELDRFVIIKKIQEAILLKDRISDFSFKKLMTWEEYADKLALLYRECTNKHSAAQTPLR